MDIIGGLEFPANDKVLATIIGLFIATEVKGIAVLMRSVIDPCRGNNLPVGTLIGDWSPPGCCSVMVEEI